MRLPVFFLSPTLASIAAGYTVEPFRIDIPQADVARMKSLVANTRLPEPPAFTGAGSDYGMPRDKLESLRQIWASKAFDWEEEQEALNQYPQFTVAIEGIKLHFVHSRPTAGHNRIPLLMTHGFPGTFAEYLPAVKPLVNAGYEVVIPSLPGFAFSSPPPLDWKPKDTTRIFNKLMVDVLGFKRYMIFGSDWGSVMAYELYANYTENVGAAVFSMIPFRSPTVDDITKENITLTPYEQFGVELATKWSQVGTGYAVEQATKPNTIGLALHDNPVGQLAWLGSLFYDTSDPNGGLTDRDVLRIVSLTYLSQSFFSSVWIYTTGGLLTSFDVPRPATPMGFTAYKYNPAQWPRVYIEKVGNLTLYKEHEFGGHYPGLESPETLVADIQEMAKKYW